MTKEYALQEENILEDDRKVSVREESGRRGFRGAARSSAGASRQTRSLTLRLFLRRQLAAAVTHDPKG